MKVREIRFLVYANNDDEAEKLSDALFAFVDEKRMKGIAVTANALTDALNKYKGNIFVNQFLKSYSNGK
jgi:hypothetical protein